MNVIKNQIKNVGRLGCVFMLAKFSWKSRKIQVSSFSQDEVPIFAPEYVVIESQIPEKSSTFRTRDILFQGFIYTDIFVLCPGFDIKLVLTLLFNRFHIYIYKTYNSQVLH